ncbi:hypothetical protein EV363DRAFT_523142 [Boletus edulis]|nr:hypothetical protein EV363DRAFT_523142 [Boletus edulis]
MPFPDSKKRAADTRASSSSLSPVPDDLEPLPKSKKCTFMPIQTARPPLTTSVAKCAETRPCPACSERIPIRLLAAHAKLETRRVEDIISHIGDAEVLAGGRRPRATER